MMYPCDRDSTEIWVRGELFEGSVNSDGNGYWRWRVFRRNGGLMVVDEGVSQTREEAEAVVCGSIDARDAVFRQSGVVRRKGIEVQGSLIGD